MADVRPIDVPAAALGIGILTDTTGRVETEAVAAYVVRWHHLHSPDAWAPVSRADLASLLDTDEVAQRWANNPFIRLSPKEFSERGFIEGWHATDAAAKGTLTSRFFDALTKRFAPSPAGRR